MLEKYCGSTRRPLSLSFHHIEMGRPRLSKFAHVHACTCESRQLHTCWLRLIWCEKMPRIPKTTGWDEKSAAGGMVGGVRTTSRSGSFGGVCSLGHDRLGSNSFLVGEAEQAILKRS